jgi:hypothetical protein
MSLRVLDLPVDRLEGDAVAALFFQDVLPLRGPGALLDWRLNGALTRQLLRGKVSGKAGEHLLVPNNGKLGAGWVLFIGGGRWAPLELEDYRNLLRHLLETCCQARFSRIAIGLAPLPGMSASDLERMAAAALTTLAVPPPECLLSLGDEGTGRTLPRR